jgi:uracil-DNA glycosylase family 4
VITVPGASPSLSSLVSSRLRIMVIGEAPGRKEAELGIPFVGPSGKLLDSYLSFSNLPPLRDTYRTNLIKLYQEGNPDPTPSLIADYTPTLLREIAEFHPNIILSVGKYSTQFFLGDSCPDLETIHGIPHSLSNLRSDLPECIHSSTLIPTFHPAGGLWNYERRSIIRYGYQLAGKWYERLSKGLDIHFREDEFSGLEEYEDVTGRELRAILASSRGISIIGLDTEGTPDEPWSIQISLSPGQGYLLRVAQSDFSLGVESLSRFLWSVRPIVCMHQASTPVLSCYDVVMCRAMGLELQGLDWFDTMYWAYISRLESQSNKTLCERWQGMVMHDYQSTIGNIGRDKQIAYLEKAYSISSSFSKPPKRREKLNTGRWKETQPKHIHSSIDRILADIIDGKVDKDDNPTDPYKRWKGLSESNPIQVREVTRQLGKMPTGSLSDIPLSEATIYACKDSDGTLRNALTFMEMNRHDPRLDKLMKEGMQYLPHVETIQHNGMPVSISKIRALYKEMDDELDPLLSKLSLDYWDGQPFNPNSRPQVAALCRRLGIKPALRTPTGQASTSKKSIEEYRFTNPAISLVFECRERAHNRDTYCADVISRIPDNWDESTNDILTIHANFNCTKIPTRRLAASNPNILGIPVRTELGRRVRHCYIAPPGKIICSFDLSGVEVRCLAHLSRDPILMDVFFRRINVHKDTAMRLFGLSSIDQVSDIQKAVAKTINFLIIYGGGASNLFDQFRSNNIRGYTLDDCKRFRQKWFQTYQGVDQYVKRVIAESKQSELSQDDYSGMIRYLPGINSGENQVESEEGRVAVSQKVQGLAQTMIRNSTIYLMDQLQVLIDAGELDPECFRLQLHDELTFIVNKGEEEILEPLAIHALTEKSGVKLIVPVEAESHYGYTWGECK